jgi:hypothetical protein
VQLLIDRNAAAGALTERTQSGHGLSAATAISTVMVGVPRVDRGQDW